jgi:hypothetical protein
VEAPPDDKARDKEAGKDKAQAKLNDGSKIGALDW